MMMFKQLAASRLAHASITFNGSNGWDPQFPHPEREEEVFRRITLHGSLGIGETYMEGLWRTKDEAALEELCYRMFRHQAHANFNSVSTMALELKAKIINRQKHRERVVGETHYDKFSRIQHHVLGPSGQYSCAHWENATTLNEAQQFKQHRIAKKLKLEPGMKVLDIGCGWGYLARFLARNYHVTMTGTTISHEQALFARDHCAEYPVTILEQPFAEMPIELHGTFDRIVSVGMFEHVGPKNYRSFFEKARKLLKPDGIMLLHTIGGHRDQMATDPWIDKYIFPNGVIPSQRQVVDAYAEIFAMRDWDEFGLDYHKTLVAWYQNFKRAWPDIRTKEGYDDVFYRMTVFYLLSCAASFRAGRHQLWQIILTPFDSAPREYRSVR